MAARNVANPVILSSEQREQLESFTRSRSLPQAHVQRARDFPQIAGYGESQ